MTTPRDLSYISVIPPDGGWGWVVSVGAAWCNGAIFGMINSYSKMMVHIQEAYPTSDNYSASWVNSLFMGLTLALSPVAGILSDKYGIRAICMTGSLVATLGMFASSFTSTITQLMITYGVILGIGSSLTYSPSLVIIGHYFDKRLGLVNGLVTFFGSSLFTVCMPHVLDYLFETMPLKNVFRVLSLLYVIMLCFSTTFSTVQKPIHRPRSGIPFVNEKLLQRGYMVWVISVSLGLSGYTIIYTYIVPYVMQATGSNDGSLMISVIGGSAAVGRLLFGRVSDIPGVNRVMLQQMCLLTFGACYFAMPYLSSFRFILINCLCFGLADGCLVTMMGPVAYDIVGNKGASQGLGFAFLVMSICMIFGAPIAGKIYDRTRSLDVAFILSGSAAAFGSATLCLIPRWKRSTNTKKTDSTSEKIKREQYQNEIKIGSKLQGYNMDSILDLDRGATTDNPDPLDGFYSGAQQMASSSLYLSTDILYDRIRNPQTTNEVIYVDPQTIVAQQPQSTIDTKLSEGKETFL